MLSVDIPEERNCLELLRHVVTLWLTIRGFSITKAWMEDYKSAVCTTTKGKKGYVNSRELQKHQHHTDY